MKLSHTKKVNCDTISVLAPITQQGGWGTHARNFIGALSDFVKLNVFEIGKVFNFRDYTEFSKYPLIILAPPSFTFIPTKNYTAFYTVWETSFLPTKFQNNLSSATEIWVPTTWGRHIFIESGLNETPINVVPEGVNSQVFCPLPTRREKSTFDFLFVGKWEERKGIIDLIDAFCEEFSAHENARLILHFGFRYFFNRDVEDLVKHQIARNRSEDLRIQVSTTCTESELISLMQTSDIVVLPTKAEGWGLPLLEAMACGTPCIATNYGGQTAFMNDANSYLIPVETMIPAIDRHFFPGGFEWGQWAQPDISELKKLLRYTYNNPGDVKSKGKQARLDALCWSWRSSAIAGLKNIEKTLSQY